MSQDLGKDFIKLAAGSSATVYADLARFTTNITTPESLELGTRDEDDDCLMPVVETYEFGLGALAGAFVQFRDEIWGPTPNTSIQIYYTTLYSACAVDPASKTAAVEARQTEPPLLDGRQVRTATEVTSVVTVTNVVCQEPGLRNCPASLQSTFQVTTTSTAIVSVAPGEEPTFPATATAGRPAALQSFGDAVQRVKESVGSPVSYIPPLPTNINGSNIGDGINGIIDDAKDEVNKWSPEFKQLVIGLSAGLGGAFITAVILGVWYVLPFCPFVELVDLLIFLGYAARGVPGTTPWRDRTFLRFMVQMLPSLSSGLSQQRGGSRSRLASACVSIHPETLGPVRLSLTLNAASVHRPPPHY